MIIKSTKDLIEYITRMLEEEQDVVDANGCIPYKDYAKLCMSVVAKLKKMEVPDVSKEKETDGMIEVYYGEGYVVYREEVTEVMYVKSHTGGFTVMLDRSGYPLTFDRWKRLKMERKKD